MSMIFHNFLDFYNFHDFLRPLILNGIGQTKPTDVNYTLTAIINQVAPYLQCAIIYLAPGLQSTLHRILC